MNKKILLIIAVVASTTLSAHAQNLVVNPGFETGDLTGWPGGDHSGVFVSSGNPHSGNFNCYLGAVGTDGTLSQDITTVVGQAYQVDFWLYSPGGTPNDFSASFAGVTFFSATNAGPFPYTDEVSGNIVATSTTSTLLFSARQDPSYWNLDDVTVVAVPEPGTLGLIALGGLGLVAALRKRLA
jgi:hypothetical protein